jgi:hypothetical protein
MVIKYIGHGGSFGPYEILLNGTFGPDAEYTVLLGAGTINITDVTGTTSSNFLEIITFSPPGNITAFPPSVTNEWDVYYRMVWEQKDVGEITDLSFRTASADPLDINLVASNTTFNTAEARVIDTSRAIQYTFPGFSVDANLTTTVAIQFPNPTYEIVSNLLFFLLLVMMDVFLCVFFLKFILISKIEIQLPIWKNF